MLLYLIVPTPDGSRVLARPNGLAGWTLPAVAVPEGWTVPHLAADWTERLLAAAAAIVGCPIVPEFQIVPGTWVVTPRGRIPSAGSEWIAVEDGARVGAHSPAIHAYALESVHRAEGTDTENWR